MRIPSVASASQRPEVTASTAKGKGGMEEEEEEAATHQGFMDIEIFDTIKLRASQRTPQLIRETPVSAPTPPRRQPTYRSPGW